jgi:hypothetical protein
MVKRSGVSVKTMKRMLKKAGLKTTGRKVALTRRVKKARLMRGGVAGPTVSSPPEPLPCDNPLEVRNAAGDCVAEIAGGRRRRSSRKSHRSMY